jgi:hypothetical protein
MNHGMRKRTGGYRQTSTPMPIRFNAMITEEDNCAIERLANSQNVTMSEMIRRLIRAEVLRQNKENDHG